MPEPTTTTAAAAWIAAASSVSMALFGVDLHAMVYGLVGSLVALSQAETMPRARAMTFVAGSTIAGAAIGTFSAQYLGLTGKYGIFVGCIAGGYGAPALLRGVLQVVSDKLAKFSGVAK